MTTCYQLWLFAEFEDPPAEYHRRAIKSRTESAKPVSEPSEPDGVAIRLTSKARALLARIEQRERTAELDKLARERWLGPSSPFTQECAPRMKLE